MHINCTPPYPQYLAQHCAGTNKNTTMFGTTPSLCASLSFLVLVVYGWRLKPATLQGAVLFVVVGAWTRHDRDPESDENAWICRIVNPTLGCKDIKWSDNRLVLSVILFIQLLNCMHVHTCNRP